MDIKDDQEGWGYLNPDGTWSRQLTGKNNDFRSIGCMAKKLEEIEIIRTKKAAPKGEFVIMTATECNLPFSQVVSSKTSQVTELRTYKKGQ